MAFQQTIGVNMADLYPFFKELSRYQQRSVAFERVFFGTHKSYAVTLHALHYPSYSRSEARLLGQALVLNLALTVTSWVFTPRT